MSDESALRVQQALDDVGGVEFVDRTREKPVYDAVVTVLAEVVADE